MARPLVDFVLPAIALGLLTALMFFLPIDLIVQRWFFSAESGGWFLKDADPLQLIYKRGLLPALGVAVAAVLLILAGLRSESSVRRYRKVAIYLLLVMVIAPGLFVNALMKEGWGRPRPRQVEEFGGKEAYERVWEYDGSSYGKSFPSGHAAMGFYFFALYFLMRREGRGAVLLWLGIALGLGALLGFTRVAQGGHFPSDVLWSAGVCYFVAAGLYYAMGLHRRLWFAGEQMSRGSVLATVVAVLGISTLAVGTPYHEEKQFSVAAEEFAGIEKLRLKVESPRANLRLIPAGDGSLEMKAEAEGFGSPGSRIEDRFPEPQREGNTLKVSLRQDSSGFFATSEQAMNLTVPRGVEIDADIIVAKGVVTLELAADSRGFWDFDLGDADLNVLVPDGLELKLEYGDEAEVESGQSSVEGMDFDAEKRRWKRGESPTVKLRLRKMSGGTVEFRRP